MGFKIGLSSRRREMLEEELKRILGKISKVGVEKVILFGSLSTGNIHKSSDLDIIVVMRTQKRFLDRLEEIYRFLSPRVSVDILVYTSEEFEEMREKNEFLKSALKRGRVIWGN